MARQAAINGETPARPMQRASLHNELVAGLREMIFSGELPGGGRVPERLLCERFAVSRTPLREALKVLASEGLLELLPNRGARVNKLTVEAVDEMFPVMGALEGLAGELACERITDDAIDEIRALHYQMASHQKRGELGEYFALNQRIHAKILEAAGNPTLSVIFTSLTARIRLARYRANLSKDRWSHAMAEHEDILNALAARDGRRLSAVLSDHLAKTCETVKEVIRADEAGRQRTAQFGGGDG
jgi:DNA-binding GntR family transcriptional regulator